MTTLAITEKLSNDLSVITTCLAKLCEDGLQQRNILFFSAAFIRNVWKEWKFVVI